MTLRRSQRSQGTPLINFVFDPASKKKIPINPQSNPSDASPSISTELKSTPPPRSSSSEDAPPTRKNITTNTKSKFRSNSKHTETKCPL